MAIVVCAALAAMSGVAGLAAQDGGPAEPWFGVTLPPPWDPHRLEVLSERTAAPAVVPPGEERFEELAGSAIREHLETIVGFSRESQTTAEIGDGQLWGRVTGFPSGLKTVEWALDRFETVGIPDVELQRFSQDPDASMWLPLSWEARLLGHPAFGVGTQDIVLESAMPLSVAESWTGKLIAPLVHVGMASAAELAYLDVRGKVAVQHVTPQGHTVFEREHVGSRTRDLIQRGALAVLRVIDLPGNVRSRDLGCGTSTCFNLGGRDGRFLEAVMNAAAEADVLPELRIQLRVDSQRLSGLSGANGVAVVPGRSRADEYVVLNAHTDAWFDGAGDNGDGLAVLVALARHFARPDMRQPRSLVFVASAGHHSPGLSGPGHFLSMNPDVTERTALVVNLEHTSQRHITPARSNHEDGYRAWTMDAREAPIVTGISNLSPFLDDVVRRGITRYGTNFVAGPSAMASGEGGAYRRAGIPVFTAMQGPPMYHTTGEVTGMVSTPDLERMARFVAFLVKEVGRAPLDQIDPPASAGSPQP